MAAGQGFKTFTTGEVLTASDVNGYLMQGVLVFASAAARDAAITSPQEGQYAYLKDTNVTYYYDGSTWVVSGATGDITSVTAGTGISGGGASGDVTITNSMATAIDAKGDLVVGTGADAFSRLAVGANDTVLTADSTTATGLKWATSAAGSMTLISTTTLSGTSVTLSSIPSTYLNLYLELYDARWATGAQEIRLTTNSFGTDGAQSGTANNIVNSTTAATYWNLSGDGNSHQANGFYSAINIWGYNNTRNLAAWQTLYYSGGLYKASNFAGGKFGGNVTSITISGSSSYAFSGGTIKLYGVK